MNIVQMLDQLAEYQAQIDYLNIEKQKLLESVQVPEEVKKAGEERDKRLKENSDAFHRLSEALAKEKAARLAEIHDPELPPEYMAALNEANRKRGEIMLEISEQEKAALSNFFSIQTSINEQSGRAINDALSQVNQRKSEITAEFTGKVEAANENIAKLTGEIKTAVEQFGESVKGKVFHAVYVKGRTTWTTDVLDGVYFSLNELLNTMKGWSTAEGLIGRDVVRKIIAEMTKARKVGKPSVTIRKV